MKYIYLILITIVVIAISSISAFAGPGSPPATPIDGGLSLLLAAGGAYGVKKFMKKEK